MNQRNMIKILKSKEELNLGFALRIEVFVKEQKEHDLETLIKEENLNSEETRKFLDNSFRDGEVKTTGTDIEKILPPMRRFGGDNKTERKQNIIAKISKFFGYCFFLFIYLCIFLKIISLI